MELIRDDNYWVELLLKDCEIISESIKNKTFEDFKKSTILQDAICFRIVQISEHSKKISMEYKDKFNSIPWNLISGLRNKIVHDYGSINFQIIFFVATSDVQEIAKIIKTVLEN